MRASWHTARTIAVFTADVAIVYLFCFCLFFVCLFFCLFFLFNFYVFFFFSFENDFYRRAGMLLVQFLTSCYHFFLTHVVEPDFVLLLSLLAIENCNTTNLTQQIFFVRYWIAQKSTRFFPVQPCQCQWLATNKDAFDRWSGRKSHLLLQWQRSSIWRWK